MSPQTGLPTSPTPSAFAMTPDAVRWIYRLDGDLIEARAWCASRQAAAFLELRVVTGRPRRFLVPHQLALGANELDQGGELSIVMHQRLDALMPDRHMIFIEPSGSSGFTPKSTGWTRTGWESQAPAPEAIFR